MKLKNFGDLKVGTIGLLINSETRLVKKIKKSSADANCIDLVTLKEDCIKPNALVIYPIKDKRKFL